MKKKFYAFRIVELLLILQLMIIGCTPRTITKTRYEFVPYQPGDLKQTKENITIECKPLHLYPEEFYINFQGCDSKTKQLSTYNDGTVKMERTIIIPDNLFIQEIKITNSTDKLIKLSSITIIARDPSNQPIYMLDNEGIANLLTFNKTYSSTNKLPNQLQHIKFIDHNSEILPNSTTTGYLIYNPIEPIFPGVWRLSMLDVPAKTNSSGQITKTVNFNFIFVQKEYCDTFEKKFPFIKYKKISTEEVYN